MNRWYFWSMLHRPGYVPPAWVARICGIKLDRHKPRFAIPYDGLRAADYIIRRMAPEDRALLTWQLIAAADADLDAELG